MQRCIRAPFRCALPVVVLILAASLTITASASATTPTSNPCSITSVPSFVAQGEFSEASSVADIIEVQCEKVYAFKSVRITATALYNRCQKKLLWSVATPFSAVPGSGYTVKLDGNGRAVVSVWGGPSCAPGESLLSGHLEGPPYSTVTTKFNILSPMVTEAGVFALTPNGKSSEIENSVTSSVAVIIQIEYPPEYAEQPVKVSAEQLYLQCHLAPRLRWVGADGKEIASGVPTISGLKLDNDGNAFVVVLGGPSCAAAPGEIAVNLENPPFTPHTTTFTVLAPQ